MRSCASFPPVKSSLPQPSLGEVSSGVAFPSRSRNQEAAPQSTSSPAVRRAVRRRHSPSAAPLRRALRRAPLRRALRRARSLPGETSSGEEASPPSPSLSRDLQLRRGVSGVPPLPDSPPLKLSPLPFPFYSIIELWQ